MNHLEKGPVNWFIEIFLHFSLELLTVTMVIVDSLS